jgi:hypothetical protein
MSFRALKAIYTRWSYNMRTKESEYAHMYVMVREASREARCWGFQPHEERSVAILREKWRGLGRRVSGQWVPH